VVFGDEFAVGDDEVGLLAEREFFQEPVNDHGFFELVLLPFPIDFHGYLLSIMDGHCKEMYAHIRSIIVLRSDDGVERKAFARALKCLAPSNVH
jgi:hypothetical protein